MNFAEPSDKCSPIDDEESWPCRDENGKILAYTKDGRWCNYWSRNKPCFFRILWGFLTVKDDSCIPWSSPSKLEAGLPIIKPYWLTSNRGEIRKGCRLTWLGHASVLAEVDSAVILMDPIFSQRCSPSQLFGPKRYRSCPIQSASQLPEKLDALVISHNHYDHLDFNTLSDISNRYCGTDLQWFVPAGIGLWMQRNFNQLHLGRNLHEMLWWQERYFAEGSSKIIFTPSNHWSRRGICDRNKSLWGSWAVVGAQQSKFFFAGDTAYVAELFVQIGRFLGPFDLAAIPIGAYHPRSLMAIFHVDPEEAVSIHEDIGSRMSVGIHWGTFRLSYEPWLEPRTRLAEEVKRRCSKWPFVTINIGAFIDN